MAARFLILLAGLLACGATARAQSLALTTDSEEGFQRLIAMAQKGDLGEAVANANIAIAHDHVRLQLVRVGRPPLEFLLTRAPASSPRYFDVAAGDNAAAGDVQRVERALAAAFREDPFQVAGLEESHAREPIPSLGQAWEDGGWRGVAHAGRRWMMRLAGRDYTVAVIAGLALCTLASLALLWGTVPTPPAPDH